MRGYLTEILIALAVTALLVLWPPMACEQPSDLAHPTPPPPASSP